MWCRTVLLKHDVNFDKIINIEFYKANNNIFNKELNKMLDSIKYLELNLYNSIKLDNDNNYCDNLNLNSC